VPQKKIDWRVTPGSSGVLDGVWLSMQNRQCFNMSSRLLVTCPTGPLIDMKRPRVTKGYCPKCKKHTDQEIERVKTKPRSELKWGQRRYRKATSGYGGFPRPKYEGRQKPTTRVSLRYRCKVCKKAYQRPCIRSKTFEFKEA